MLFVTSDSVPYLALVSEAELPEVLAEAVHSGNFFHGLNPFVLATLFQEGSPLSPLVAASQLLRPWRWDFGVRHYAVTAVRFQRA